MKDKEITLEILLFVIRIYANVVMSHLHYYFLHYMIF